MGKLKAIGGRLATLKPTLGMLAPSERTEMQERKLFSPWRDWYKTARWRELRLKVLERDGYQCQRCGLIEPRSSQLIANHKTPHRGDETLFWHEDNLETVCKPCHDGPIQREERAALAS